jgi:hypothetical protein
VRPPPPGVDGSVPGVDGSTPACALDGITWHGNQYQVVAKGKAWSISGSGAMVGDPAGSDLRTLSGLKDGPCATQGTVCHLDTFTWLEERQEYYVAYGSKTWILDAAAALKSAAAGTPNDDAPTLAAGPCAGQPAGGCSLEAYAWRSGLQYLYVMNAGKVWTFDGSLNAVGDSAGVALSTLAGLQPMCTSLGGTCKVDDLTWRDDANRFDIIAGGKVWFVDADGAPVAGSGTDLRSYAGFAQGPCAP